MPALKHGFIKNQAPLHGRLKVLLYDAAMTELFERIAAARAAADLTLEQVGSHFGITPQAVQQWEKPDGTKPSLSRMVALADVLGVSLDFLIRGVAIPTDPTPVRFDKKRYAPVLNRVAAGGWNDVVTPDNLPDGTVFLELSDTPIGDAIVLEIDGESMLPDFRSGDLVIVDTGLEPTPGDFVVAVLNGEQAATFKKFRLRGVDKQGSPVIDLVPLNPDWPTLTLDAGNPGRILGTMIEHRRLRKRLTSAA